MMAPKMLRRLKKKSGGHTTSLIDREEISDQIRVIPNTPFAPHTLSLIRTPNL